MRIAILAGEVGVSDQGVYVLALRRGLEEAGHEVRVVASGGAFAAPLSGESLVDERHGLVGTPWRDVFDVARVCERLGSFAPEILHVVTSRLDAVGARIARQLGVPRITTIHGTPPRDVLARRRPAAIVVPGQGGRAHAVNSLKIDRALVHVVPYGMWTFPEVREEHVRPVVGTLGPLRSGRGLEHFVHAAAEVARPFPEALFSVIGSGPYHRHLIRHARAAGITEQLVVCEPAAEPDILCRAWDVAAFASTQEDCGYLVLVAMHAGLPIVASALGTAFDLVRDGDCGYLVPPGDAHVLGERIRELLEDPERARAMGDAARLRARQGHALATMIRATTAIYESTLAEQVASRG